MNADTAPDDGRSDSGTNSDLTNTPEGELPMLKNALKLFKDEEGATAVEYGLIVAAIAGIIIAIVFVLGNKVKNQFNNVQSALP
ncbi:MAG TPA: Flp family type IVb pilin [Polyangia bacterium]|nr:Flp family type IVb pilin [Polyangia bacterium]